MRRIYTLSFLLFGIFSQQSADAQLYIIGEGAQPNDVNNIGTVAGTLGNVTNIVWTQENGLQEIGTLAEGLMAGNSLISENNVYAGYMTNPETNLNETSIYNLTTNTWTHLGRIAGASDASKS